MLRPYQEECLDAILSKYVEGIRRQLVVKATGTGKAVVIANIQKKFKHLLPGKVLVFVHTEELVDQLVETYEEWNPGVKVGKERAEFYADTDCDVVVSCVASIGRNGSTRLSRFGKFDIIICDEAHHSIAQTYINVFKATNALEPSSSVLLVGFTATPKRKNRKVKPVEGEDEQLLSLKSVYQEIVYTYPIRKAVKEGWLVPLRGYRINTDINLDNIKRVAGDFQQDQLAEAVDQHKINLEVLDAWKKYGENRQSVFFAASIQHAQNLAKIFKENGVKAEAIWGNDPERHDFSRCNACGTYRSKEYKNTACIKNLGTKEQPICCSGTLVFGKGKLERHEDKEITVLFNAKLLTEGYDDWQVSCIGCVAPTSNSTVYTQEVGRGTRLQKGTGNLLEAIKKGIALSKKDCIVLDLVGVSKQCSLVTLPSLVGLNPEMDLHGGSATAVAERMEELQDKYPMVDLSSLTDIDKVDAYMESIDLFAEPYTEDVKQYSHLSWIAASDGSYILAIPEKREVKGEYWNYMHEKLHITPNELDEYELSISSAKDAERKLATCSTLKEAFETADDVIRRCRADRLKLLTRDGYWRDQPASEAVKSYLRKLTKKKPLLKCLCPGFGIIGKQCQTCKQIPITAGEASTAIEILKVRK